MAPRIGATRATRIPAAELANPSWAVLTTGSVPTVQYSLKKIGKKEAMTVVAKAEFAQSYMTHPNMALRFSFISRIRSALQKTLRGLRRVFQSEDRAPGITSRWRSWQHSRAVYLTWELDTVCFTRMSVGVTGLS